MTAHRVGLENQSPPMRRDTWGMWDKVRDATGPKEEYKDYKVMGEA